MKPLMAAIPIGALVRVEFAITNMTEQALPIPANLTMKGGAARTGRRSLGDREDVLAARPVYRGGGDR